ncbi:MAG: hypothetical protein ACOC8D_02210 [bacterium]
MRRRRTTWLALTVALACAATPAVAGTVVGADPAEISVESGPGGPAPLAFTFPVKVMDVEDLWDWQFHAKDPVDGPGTVKPEIIDAAEGDWWQFDVWPPQYTSEGVLCSGGDTFEIPPQTQSGSGPLMHLTVSYEGCEVGDYTLMIGDTGLHTVGDSLDPPLIPHDVVNLTIHVEPGVPPEAVAWLAEPAATGTGSVAMTVAETTDADSPPVQYQFDADGGMGRDWGASREFTDAGLSPNSLHAYRVRARDGVGNATGWSQAVSVYTWAEEPGPGAPPLEALSVSALRAQWTTGANPAGTDYEAGVWSGLTATGQPARVLATTESSVECTALSTNAPYTVQVRAVNHDGRETAWAALGSIHTQAQRPTAAIPALDLITTTGARAHWTTGTNPQGTHYQVGVWPGPTADGQPPLTFDTTEAAVDCTGLEVNHQYTFAVRAFNGDGQPTAWEPLGTVYTLAEAPLAGGTPVEPVDETSLQARWLAAGNPAGTRYHAQCFQGPDETGTPAGDRTGTDLARVFDSLAPNRRYFCRVRALNGDGEATGWTALGTAYTLAAPPGRVEVHGLAVLGLAFNPDGPAAHSLGIVTVELNGNPATTRFAVRIGGQADAGWLRFGDPDLDPTEDPRDLYPEAAAAGAVWLTQAEWEGLRVRGLAAEAPHGFQAVARNEARVPTAAVAGDTVRTTAEGDVNGDGSPTALDYALLREALLRGAAIDQAWPCNVHHHDRQLDALDLQAAQDRILNW